MKNFSKNQIIIISISVFLIVLLSILSYFFIEISGVMRVDRDIEVSINENDNISMIASKLQSAGAIGNDFIFKLYSKFNSKTSRLQVGEFILKAKKSYGDIVNVLSSNQNNVDKMLKISVIEGENMQTIAEKVEKVGVCSKQDFITAANKKYGFKFEDYQVENSLKLYRNEGYLFPDTYIITKDATAESVAKQMLDNFDKKFTDKYYKRMEELKLNLDQTIALASIVQHEASNLDDMKMVSGIFYNRLDPKNNLPKLQSDVTVFYARDIVKKLTGNESMVTAYSTYLSDGIPVGPICSPGMNAIDATLYPTKSDYLYFLTDMQGKFYYAVTFDEHLKNDEISKKINSQVNQ